MVKRWRFKFLQAEYDKGQEWEILNSAIDAVAAAIGPRSARKEEWEEDQIETDTETECLDAIRILHRRHHRSFGIG